MPAAAETEKAIRQENGGSRVLIVQYAGDYLAAYERLKQHKGEVYFAHGYVLEQAARIGALYGDAAILCCRSSRQYVTRLPEGLTVMGAGADPRREEAVILEHLSGYNPSHLVVLGPLTSILRWGAATGRRTLGIFADSFEISRLRRLYRYGQIGKVLNGGGVEWVANHGVNASRSLARIGVAPEKIIPWDWDYPRHRHPSAMPPKTTWSQDNLTILFVGAVTRPKGVGDVIQALRSLRNRGLPFRLEIVGEGDLEAFKVLAQRLGVKADVHFLGAVSNEKVLDLMRSATVVAIPSRHAYPEGVPLTIYEALCSRTPIVASDHPMFRGHLRDRQTAMVFRAGDAQGMALKIEELLSDAALYASLSRASVAAWEGLQVPVKWGDLLHRWVRNESGDREWLKQHCLSHAQ